MSIPFWLICLIVMSIATIDGLFYLGSLTEQECRAYFASNDVYKNLHAHFSCPKKLRPKHKRIETSIAKRSLMVINNRQAKARVPGRMITNRL